MKMLSLPYFKINQQINSSVLKKGEHVAIQLNKSSYLYMRNGM